VILLLASTGNGFGALWRRAVLAAFPENKDARFTFNDLRIDASTTRK
jgi:hypothetical protein